MSKTGKLVEKMQPQSIFIKLWDNEDYEYPLIEIFDKDVERFKKDLKKYQKEKDYNLDNFIAILETKPYFLRTISPNVKVFF